MKEFYCFAKEMEKKFFVNAKEKGYGLEPWKDFPVNWLMNRMRQEMQELYGAVEKYNLDFNSSKSKKEVQDECVDIANFCAFIYNAINNIKKEEQKDELV